MLSIAVPPVYLGIRWTEQPYDLHVIIAPGCQQARLSERKGLAREHCVAYLKAPLWAASQISREYPGTARHEEIPQPL